MLTLEHVQDFWIKQANDKAKPWLPDFELGPSALQRFLRTHAPSSEKGHTVAVLDHGWDNDVYLINDTIFRCPR